MTTKSQASALWVGQALGWTGMAVLIWLIGSLTAASLWAFAVVVATPLVLVAIATTLDCQHSVLRRILLWTGIALWLYFLLTQLRFLFPPTLVWNVLTQTSLCLLLLVSAAVIKGRSYT